MNQATQNNPIQQHEAYAPLRHYKTTSTVPEMLQMHNAHAMGIGRKKVKGKSTSQIALRLYVSKKLTQRNLSSAERFPDSIQYTSRHTQNTVELITDIVELPPAVLEAFDPRKKNRPVPGGVGGGNREETGTLGGWAWDITDDTVVMISNDHVFGHTPGEPIWQPAEHFGGTSPADKIGEVKRGIVRSKNGTNVVDCAIGAPDSSQIFDLSVHDIGPAIFEIDTPVLDMQVEKYSLISHHTFGEIDDADWEGNVSSRHYEDCLLINPAGRTRDWSKGGDSGSLVFSQTPIPNAPDIKPGVGLHFAGSDTHGIACKIQNVFD